MSVCMNYKEMHYERIDDFEGTDFDETYKSKDCETCHYWYFKKLGFKSNSNVCKRCYNMKIFFG